MKQLLILFFCLTTLLLYSQESSDSLRLQPDTVTNMSVVTKKSSIGHLTFNGQATAWTILQFSNPLNTQLGARFVPALTGAWYLPKNTKLDYEASLQAMGTIGFSGSEHDTTTYVFKLYRVWMRYSGENWEVRGGLQKINFGSAKMFRPLMWFDRMDVRDPLQLTDGVYGVLGKYFFPNNANVWLWSLIGNKNPKGYELIGSATWIPEFGGRVEMPVGPGELALSTHFRKADIYTIIPMAPEKTYVNEKRIGLDGKWDVGIGLWFESSISIFDKTSYPLSVFNDMWNVGTDYTVPVGSGLGVTLEYFRYHVGTKIWSEGQSANILGTMFTYPISILDNVSAMVFYVKEADKLFNYVSYSRTYDKWSFYAIGFWNPEINLPIGGQMNGKNLFMGKGVQLMVNYYF